MKTVFALIILVALCLPCHADIVTLTNAEMLSVATSKTLEWRIITINFDDKILILEYRWIDSGGKAIIMATGGAWQRVQFQDIADDPETIDINEAITGWTDIMGAKSGVGEQLQAAVWGKLKPSIGIKSDNAATTKGNLE